MGSATILLEALDKLSPTSWESFRNDKGLGVIVSSYLLLTGCTVDRVKIMGIDAGYLMSYPDGHLCSFYISEDGSPVKTGSWAAEEKEAALNRIVNCPGNFGYKVIKL